MNKDNIFDYNNDFLKTLKDYLEATKPDDLNYDELE